MSSVIPVIISIHALCEEGDFDFGDVTASLEISIHALCEEGDLLRSVASYLLSDFYPRPLRGGRHLQKQGYKRRMVISIHALCEEGDGTGCGCGSCA